MCGFAGFIGEPLSLDQGKANLLAMGNALRQRGPDDEGIWLRNELGVGLAHRRLAVVGLGPDGHQPMRSRSGRWIIAYNGEIYNFRQLRAELTSTGTLCCGGSDTEVLLAGVETWGVVRTIERLVGMFAFALWDERERMLYLVRDRYGEKPLYFGWQGASFLFGSDLAALREHPAFVGGIDRSALAVLVARNFIPAPLTIHPDIRKLEPGSVLTLAWSDGRWHETRQSYWSPIAVAAKAVAAPFRGSEQEAIAIAHDLLCESVRGQMVADVPLGAFLSGGIDSSAVIALMQSISTVPVRSFTIGFTDSAFDESAYAACVAAHLGTVHREYRLEASDILALIPQLPYFYSEPFADASQLPTILVSRLAREDVTVALSGDGGDELFGGYNRYVWAEFFWDRSSRLPGWIRKALSRMLLTTSPLMWDIILGRLTDVHQPGEKLHKVAALLVAENPREAYERLVGFWAKSNPVLHASLAEAASPELEDLWRAGHSLTQSLMLADTMTYLPDDILVKVDRAAMGFSLETRAPFLDHRLFEFLWSLPMPFRIRRGSSKRILREILYQYVPQKLIDRPKAGFALPLGDWLRGPLRDWAENLLNSSRLRQDGFFDPAMVRRAYDEHLSGSKNRQYDLWSILMFQAWKEVWQP